jgi:predicted PurR-regulated permease PerM
MIPYVGVAIAAAAALFAGIFVSPFAGITGCVIMIVISNVIANIISPKLMGNAVNVHPALVLVVILAGGAVGGGVGMLLAIPVAATIQALSIAYYEQRYSTKITSPDGALFSESVEKKVPKNEDNT